MWTAPLLASRLLLATLIFRIPANASHFVPLTALPTGILVASLAASGLICFLAAPRHLMTALLVQAFVLFPLFCHDFKPSINLFLGVGINANHLALSQSSCQHKK